MEDLFIRKALREAIYSYTIDEIPVGAIITNGYEIISCAHNEKYSTNKSTNHAEIICINKACSKLRSWNLSNLYMYITLEPCIMCAGAIFESRIRKIYIGTSNPFNGFFSCNYHKPPLSLNINWLNDRKCEAIIDRFFFKKRKKSL